MLWLKDIQSILAKQPENWLAYLLGQQRHNLPHLKGEKLMWRGAAFTFLRALTFNIRNVSIICREARYKNIKYYIFADTQNQLNSLDTTVSSLLSKGEIVYGVADRRIIRNKFHRSVYNPFRLTLEDAINSTILLSARFNFLYALVKAEYADSKDSCLRTFFSCYPYLVFFYRDLRERKPQFVIVSNDHNVSTRCLLAISHHLGIKTVYLQHASVSNLFPALCVNYAFLDGQCALDIYRDCELNQPKELQELPSTIVILSGQKKSLSRTKSIRSAGVGIALNKLDDVSQAIHLTNFLTGLGFEVYVRCHPGLGKQGVLAIRESLKIINNAFLSEPSVDPLSSFFERIGWLVAGNSSIHLEAALSNVVPIYFEFGSPLIPDYYGYVRRGLSKKMETYEDLVGILQERKRCATQRDIEAVRFYSQTFRTQWEGREGELVAECLFQIASGSKVPLCLKELCDPVVLQRHRTE
jgi:hypothetical protein